ncbi:MAG: Na(+)-translocating NADH-quinone reductase subunit A, partial [Candidatus Omnitrophica bacterium]|nr:Na(+)-translocating NADH-quinone reductase subunit A [Candidatus Omnitrophota bacterium]
KLSTYHITKGKNIALTGSPEKIIKDGLLPKKIAIQPPDFKGVKAKVVVKPGDSVEVGSELFNAKNIEGVKVVSPVSGKVLDVRRGEKRVLLEIVVETDGRQSAKSFPKFSKEQISGLDRDTVKKQLLDGGVWPAIRQRPFSKVASPEESPKSIFVRAINTDPLAADIDFILQSREEEFQIGLAILSKLTDGDVHVCVQDGASSIALTSMKNVQMHQFSGPHPAGNVGTHIHYVDPINKGDLVWYVEAQDVIRMARLFLDGAYFTEQIVAVGGEGAVEKKYFKTIIGAPLADLLPGANLDGMRCLSGSVLTGKNVGVKGYLCFYDSQVTVIPECNKREFLGWLLPGAKKYTFTKTFLSSFLPSKAYSLNTDENGGHRAIVMNNFYDKYVSLDVLTYFLLKAVIAKDIEESERLGILECAAEDFALATFACPSKVDIGGIIQGGLDLIEKEG